jgi:RNA polymerase sigma-70 factor, ECF subfamily
MTQNTHQPISTVELNRLDQIEFGALVEPYRPELQAHCYRMVGSVQDAEDMVQEAFFRAWRRRETFEGRASLRAWLYKIATNVCLDSLKRRPRRAVPITRQAVSTLGEPIPSSIMEPIWLEPYPDDLLAADEASPEGDLAAREHITMAFIAALHLLPPRQRAVLILRDVLEWQASEVAEGLDMSVAAVKSALHRARATLATHAYRPDIEKQVIPQLDDAARRLLDDYVRAWETADVDTLMRLLKADATFSMPPIPSWYQGREVVGGLVSKTIFSGQANGRWHLRPTRANGQIAFGLYRQMDAAHIYQGYGIQVLTFQGDLIADITTFRNPDLIARFKLPSTVDLNRDRD